ncbi:hypothetical protein HYH03_002087 [Edaphochlamys debaryana]|uniref:COP9 signalosome complex subunit 4 n=1 Tax=Edaphochlamys debaryana TaxID=47281 RepID=A0A835YJM2_9CHLO|nr:hypothetical protein HYH03_002087 [Edaphochlamys debaryana]|eukprot:KAG2499790.1 hypothetical protein HYH03_002087 [Edaphochlamys debaryana]
MAQTAQQLLAPIAQLADQRQKTEGYKSALAQILDSGQPDACREFVNHMLTDEVPLVISRQLLLLFAQGIARLPPAAHVQVATAALEKLQPRVVSFEDSCVLLREDLAAALEREEEWSRAAQVLSGIDLESGGRALEAAYKLRQNIKIAMLYLEDDDPVNAEMYIKKAAALISSCKDEALELQYKTCYARILDSKRRFLEAAMRYYELSQSRPSAACELKMDEDDRDTALRSAITCTILAPAGPQRSRMLAALYKDERSTKFSDLFPFLQKVYLERILDRSEVEAFSRGLKPHHLALLPGGGTVLDRSVVQHNLAAASRLYANIGTDQLGGLLGVAAEEAEALAADMVAEGRMPGSIDQVDRLIHFGAKVEVEALLRWDDSIRAACAKVGELLDSVTALGLVGPGQAAAGGSR